MDVALRHWRKGEREKCLEELQKYREAVPTDKRALGNWHAVKCDPTDGESLKETLTAFITIQEAEEGDPSSASTNGSQGPSPVLLYNIGLVKWHQGKLNEAIEVIEVLFQKMQGLENGLAAALCLFLIEGYLRQHQPLKCKEPFQQLMARFPQSDIDSEIDWEMQKLSHSATEPAENGLPDSDTVIDMELLHLPPVSRLEGGIRDVDAVNGVDPCSASMTEALSPLVHLASAKILFALGQLGKAKTQLKSLLEASPVSVHALFLRGQIAFAEKRFKEAAQWIHQCIGVTSRDSPLRNVLLDNLGAVHYQLGKIQMACLCFSKALQNTSAALPKDQQRRLFNIGLISLQQGRFHQALSYFRQSSGVMYSMPSLWIRMAECCLALFQSSSPERDFKIEHPVIPTKGLPTITILPIADHALHKEETSKGGWLGMAYRYLFNALALLKHRGDEMESQEQSSMRATLYLKLSYVTLMLNRPEQCLNFVERLKQISDVQMEISYCAKMYEVEALCLMDRASEAAETLKSFIEQFEARSAARENGSSLENLVLAQKAMYQNLASIHCANQEFAQAKHCVQKAMLLNPNCRKSLMLRVYIELAVGNKSGALEILRSH